MKTLQDYKLEYALNDEVTTDSPLEQVLYQLLEESANDSNSSRYREEITKLIIGKKISAKKLGYDDDFEAIEVKPRNYTGKGKLTAGGNFSDFTWKRHRKYLKDNVTMLVSGFAKGKLLFVIEFPYASLTERVETVLTKHLPHGDLKSRYVRNLSFTYKDWVHGSYQVRYVRSSLNAYKGVIQKNVYTLLMTSTEQK